MSDPFAPPPPRPEPRGPPPEIPPGPPAEIGDPIIPLQDPGLPVKPDDDRPYDRPPRAR